MAVRQLRLAAIRLVAQMHIRRKVTMIVGGYSHINMMIVSCDVHVQEVTHVNRNVVASSGFVFCTCPHVCCTISLHFVGGQSKYYWYELGAYPPVSLVVAVALSTCRVDGTFNALRFSEHMRICMYV